MKPVQSVMILQDTMATPRTCLAPNRLTPIVQKISRKT
jgi:hypothetical protein